MGIAFSWSILWLAFWVAVGTIIAILDPDSIDPGEGPMFIVIFGPMGFFSGVAFGFIASIGGHGSCITGRSMIRVAGCGILGSAIVQLAYLGHGDLGLASNLKMALLFAVVGGAVTVVWLLIARHWFLQTPHSSSCAGDRF
ncbi:MAG: hypothetical protein EHM23_16610 [Acidobacteria bacterium]|nr:MAG: hypothetical protein EHM23_16610 [Acidobacteriota bacterium]